MLISLNLSCLFGTVTTDSHGTSSAFLQCSNAHKVQHILNSALPSPYDSWDPLTKPCGMHSSRLVKWPVSLAFSLSVPFLLRQKPPPPEEATPHNHLKWWLSISSAALVSLHLEGGGGCPSCSSLLLSEQFLSLFPKTYSFESHLIGLFHLLLSNVAVILRLLSHSVPFLTQGHSLNINPVLPSPCKFNKYRDAHSNQYYS